MKQFKIIVTIMIGAILMSACGGEEGLSVEEQAELTEFLEGRERVPVYRMAPPTKEFDPTKFLAEKFKLFGVDESVVYSQGGNHVASVVEPIEMPASAADNGITSATEASVMRLDMIAGAFGFSDYDRSFDRYEWFEGGPANKELAAERALALVDQLNLNVEVEVVEVNAWPKEGPKDSQVAPLSVWLTPTLNGEPYGSIWTVWFNLKHEVVAFRLNAFEPIPVATVGLLTPEEALVQHNGSMLGAADLGEIDESSLQWESSYVRPRDLDIQHFVMMVPTYKLVIDKELNLTVDVLAIRNQDYAQIDFTAPTYP